MEAVDRFKAQLIQDEKSELTVEKYARDAEQFLLWLGDGELTKKAVLAYKAELVERYAVASVNSILSAVNSYLSFIDRGDCRVKTLRQQRRAFLPEDKELTNKDSKLSRELIEAKKKYDDC